MAKTRRVAVVTGGANGLGRASAFRLAEAGRAIAIWDQDREGSVHTMNEIVDTIESLLADEGVEDMFMYVSMYVSMS